MRGLYYDKTKRTHFYEKRVPQDVLAILRQRDPKARAKWKETFPQRLGVDEAEDRAIDLLARWKAEWNALRPKPQVSVYPGLRLRVNTPLTDEAFARIAATLSVMFPGLGLKCDNLAGREPLMVDKPEDGSEPPYPGEAPYALPPTMKLADARKVCPYPDAIAPWAAYRKAKYNKDTDDPKRRDALSMLKRMCGFLKIDDLNLISGADIDRYANDYLLVPEKSGMEHGGYRAHAVFLRALFKVLALKGYIDQNPTEGRLPYQRNTGRRDILSPAQYRTIMLAARACDEPIIQLPVLMEGMSGLRPSEFVEASLLDFVWEETENGRELKLYVRKMHRQGAQRTLKTKDSERFLVAAHNIRDLLWAHVERRKAEGKRTLFDLPVHEKTGKPKYDGRTGKLATTKIGRWLHDLPGLDLQPDQTAYSLRHNVVTALERLEHKGKITESLAAYITGHVARQTTRSKVYVHRDTAEVAYAISLLPDPFKATPNMADAA